MAAHRFKDRRDAGRFLATRLERYAHRNDVTVLGLPRGGVPVAYEVALALDAPLDVFLVRKLGVPGHEELAMGAIASEGTRVVNQDVVFGAGVTEQQFERVEARERAELERREALFRDDRPLPPIEHRIVILVDDGLATGASMLAAVKALRQLNPRRIVVAVPVAPAETCREFREVVDEVVCGMTPTPFMGVGLWYENFAQTSDEQVRELLRRAAERGTSAAAGR